MATKLTKKQQTQLTEKLSGIIQKNNALQLRMSTDTSVNELNINQISGELNRIHYRAIGKDLPTEITIPVKQLGSGDPSPDNIRPIVGYTIDGIGTVYEGNLNIETGVLTVNYSSVDLGTLTWTYQANDKQYFSNIFVSGFSGWMYNVICDIYPQDNRGYTVVPTPHIRGINNNRLYIVDDSFDSTDAFNAAMLGHMTIYKLAAPETYTLTPQQMLQLLDQL